VSLGVPPTHSTMKDETEFDRFILDLTEEDFAIIDSISARRNHASNATVANPNERGEPSSRPAPLRKYRKSGVLSVTDLTGPSWCEVQYDYGLRQRRHLRVEERPLTFQSASGKEIHADHSVAAVNDAKLKEGERIHKVLEKAIHPKEVEIEVRSAEERWALRIYDMMLGLSSILKQGLCRELPVCGVRENHCIVGLIDEVRLVAPTLTSKTSRPSPKIEGTKQLHLERFFTSSPDRSPQCDPGDDEDSPSNTFVLQILDHKTRRTYSMPGQADTLPARLQLMTYKSLLEELLKPNERVFDQVWAALRLDPLKPFAPAFQRRVDDLMGDGDYSIQRASNLQLLGNAWKAFIKGRGFAVEEELKIVYLCATSESPSEDAEGIALQLAIEASLRPDEDASVRNISEAVTQRGDTLDSPTKEGYTVIGTKVFKFDRNLFTAHIRRVMQYWLGSRSPVGVELEDVGRCRSCEYENDCEWLQRKADDIAIKKTQEGYPHKSDSLCRRAERLDHGSLVL